MLRCDQCGVVETGKAPGWRAVVIPDDEEESGRLVIVYCPSCWEREFGDAPGR